MTSYYDMGEQMAVPDWMRQEVTTGTTVMAVEFDGGVILGADSRTTSYGLYIGNRVTDKLTRISDNIYCCRSGSAADTQAIADIVTYHVELLSIELGQKPLVYSTANIFKDLCYNNRDSLTAGIIVAGHDELKGGQVYCIPVGGMLSREPIAIGGSGSTYIYGFVDANYKKNMSKDACIEFVTKAIALAISRDGSSGGVVRLACITENGVERFLVAGKDLPQSGANA